MEKIRNFVENMFLSLPDTPEVREAKAHILEGMTDRYEALLAQGKNGDEAFGVVAGEFGSMEELRQELARAIDELNQQERTVLSLYYYEELTMKEIGQVMGVSEQRIGQINRKLIKKLRARMVGYMKG